MSAVLTQTGDDGTELPVAFSSTKLSQAQMAWSTIEREAYAVLVALKKYMNWIFGTQVTVYSDHNPLQYLIESAPKSAKLMRWSKSSALLLSITVGKPTLQLTAFRVCKMCTVYCIVLFDSSHYIYLVAHMFDM